MKIKEVADMNIDTNTIVSVTEANQNFFVLPELQKNMDKQLFSRIIVLSIL